MSSMDELLTGIIVLLIISIVWKWQARTRNCNRSSMTLSCGCQHGMCRCRSMARVPVRRPCPCGCMGQPVIYQRPVSSSTATTQEKINKAVTESMIGCDQNQNIQLGTFGYEPVVVDYNDGNYSGDVVQKMALEPEVAKSQEDYINGLGFAGLPTGSSHETVLEETGRSYGTSDFVGLTSRKFCKARQIATPAMESRTVPTETVKEWCSVSMSDLV